MFFIGLRANVGRFFEILCPYLEVSQKYCNFVTLNFADMANTDNSVRERILKLEHGSIFFPSDFDDIASDMAIRQTLSRMARRGEIMRVSRGIYCIPRSNRALGLDIIQPAAEDIAQKVAERDKVKIIPTGDQALNQLGLSTQVPANAVYVTNGARKKIDLGDGRSIVFRESNDIRMFEFKSKVMMLAVSALRSIGEDGIVTDILSAIKKIVRSVAPEQYNHDIRLAPVWVRRKLEE